MPTTDLPRYVVRVGELTGGRRLLSDDLALVETVVATAARRIDQIRLTNERYEVQLREEEMQKLTAEAELKALRAQINPHFLFNALTTIGYLIESAPPRAMNTLMQLTALLRGVLRSEGDFTTLGREIELVEHYLKIEHERFEERLRVRIDVPQALRHLRIPALVVQPLVENAIKHGVAPSTDRRRRGRDGAPRDRRGRESPAGVGAQHRRPPAPERAARRQRASRRRQRPAPAGRPLRRGRLVDAGRRARPRHDRRVGRAACQRWREWTRMITMPTLLRVVLADDERPARRFLINLLKTFPDVAVVGEAANGKDAIDLIERQKPDLALLDLNMPEAGGLDVARLVKAGATPSIAFVTAYDEFAVQASS